MPDRCRILLGFLLSLLPSPLCAQAPEHRPDKADAFRPLLQQLGSQHFSEREAADRALEAMGSPALEALRQAAQSPDPEVGRRAEALVEKITKRLELAKLLASRRVHWVYHDTSVAEITADLAKKTGLALTLEGEQGRYARRITFDTGETTFWKGFDRFCRAAGLVEQPTLPRRAEALAAADRRQRAVVVTSGYSSSSQAMALVLAEGKPQDRPTCYSGPFRVLSVPASGLIGPHVQAPGETLIGLQVAAEPQVIWQGLRGVRVQHAVDELGQDLTQPLEPHSSVADLQGRWASDNDIQRLMTAWPVLVPLKLAPQPSRLVKEITGTLAIQMQTPPEPLLTVEPFLNSAGQTVRGLDGWAIKVLEVQQQENGLVQVRVQLETVVPGQVVGRAMRGAFRANGAVRIWAVESLPTHAEQASWSLLDAKGQAFRLLTVQGPALPNGNWSAPELRLVFQPLDRQGEPAKLVYSGPRTVVLDVPFTLKDVPLP